LCPGYPSQSEPGACGCGKAEWYDSNENLYCIDLDSLRSHQVHLMDASGLPIASCDDCHGTETPPLLSDGLDLANTQVCNTCHSPLGAYDGVDDPDIGARFNWVSGVFSNGGFQPGKEKWCVGCHDDDPSVINGVSAPNMAGDDIYYGYYKTGHGKHGFGQAITCLACHDPDLMHVDGEARTYTAAADNYQAGYRLKLVDGQLPLDVPRVGFSTVEQFRLCFTCHDSAPFMNAGNADTNFRADVNDSCEPLNVNRHYSSRSAA